MTNPLRTSDVARRTGVSVNTVRLYESLGYLPPVPRAANGYRMFDARHVKHVELVRQAMRCTWIGGDIRRIALATLTIAADGDYAAALERAHSLSDRLQAEQDHAEAALRVLDTWVHRAAESESRASYRIGQVAQRLHVSIDELRNWERNGLYSVARADNGYRMYAQADIDRLLVIRSLRRARYSTMAILRLLQYLDAGETNHLREILDSPPPEADFETYPTDSWLSTVASMCEAAAHMLTILRELANPP